MARIRTVKPELFDDPDLGALSPSARWLFVGLLTQADKRGRLKDDPRLLKVRLCPYDDSDVSRLLDELTAARFVLRYHVDGCKYLAIRTFEKHQRPHPRELESNIPAPPTRADRRGHEKVRPSREKPRPNVDEHCQSVGKGRSTGKEYWEGSTGKGREGKGSGEGKGSPSDDDGDSAADAAIPPAERPEDLQAAWNECTAPPIPRALELREQRRVKCRARLQERPLEVWREVFQRINASPFCRGETDRGDWVATFDWVIRSAETAARVLEGKYDDRRIRGDPALSEKGRRTAEAAERVLARLEQGRS